MAASDDNVFSSLAGLRFLWTLLPKSGQTDGKHHLVHVPLKETPLSDCGGFRGDLEMQIEIEDQCLGSDLHVVKGIEIGQEVVSVQLVESELEHAVDTIVLTVTEAMSLDPPSPFFVTVGSVISYRLQIIRLNAAQEPEKLATEVLHTQGVEFGSRPRNVVFDIFTANGQDMVFTEYGEHWRKMRRIMTLPFFTQKLLCTSASKSN